MSALWEASVKDKTTAYLLWFFLGGWGIHKFYLDNSGMGVVYLMTGGLCGVGWLVDLFTLSGQVDEYNRTHGLLPASPQAQNIIVNVSTPTAALPAVTMPPAAAVSAEKQILGLGGTGARVSLRQVVTQTSLEIDEAQAALRNLVERGLAREIAEPDGKISYDLD